MSPSAVIFTGIQATGKSTFFARRFADTHVRVNLDMLKTRHRERVLIETCIGIRQSFVIDNTNVSAEERRCYFDLLAGRGFQVTGYYFQSRVSEALARNAGRPAARRIPDAGVRDTSARLRLPAIDEGFHELYYVRMSEEGDFTVEAWAV